MRGIQYVVDETGQQTAVLIDLREWGEWWEDIYDGLIAESRKHNSKISWEDFEAEKIGFVSEITVLSTVSMTTYDL